MAANTDLVKSRPWMCSACNHRYARPRRLRARGRLIVGECWACGGDMHHVIQPIEGNAFAGESLVHMMLRKAKEPGPKDWSPRDKRKGP